MAPLSHARNRDRVPYIGTTYRHARHERARQDHMQMSSAIDVSDRSGWEGESETSLRLRGDDESVDDCSSMRRVYDPSRDCICMQFAVTQGWRAGGATSTHGVPTGDALDRAKAVPLSSSWTTFASPKATGREADG
eukprot:2637044-Prymnesium_polylepis.1